MKIKTLETRDLIIRKTIFDDLEQFYLWEQTPQVTEFFSIREGQTRDEVFHKFFADEDDPAAEQFTILLKGSRAGSAGKPKSVGAGFNADARSTPTAGSDIAADTTSDTTSDTTADTTADTVPAVIGRIILADIIPGWKAELWRIYIGDTALRGKGYGRQAMEAIMDYCFTELDLQRLYLDHYTGNPAGFLYENLGFQREGVLRKNCRKNGILYDVHLMSMLKEEYLRLHRQ